MTCAAPLLLPNFGAEEGEATTRPSSGKTVLAPLWALLFESAVTVDGGAPLPVRPSWFGDEGEGPAFPWLAGVEGVVPWLSTPRAAERARALARPVFGPASDVAERLSDKAWALGSARAERLVPNEIASLLVPLDAQLLSRSAEAKAHLESVLSAYPSWVESYTLKPRYGSSGRGRVAGRPPLVDERTAASFPRLAARGGALLEPWLSRTRDLSVQLLITDDDVHVLASTQQILRPSGLYEGNLGVLTDEGTRSGTPWDTALLDAGRCIGERARREGFRGPCGIDAFTFVVDGREVFRPVVELNARFTTGTIAVGMVARALRAGKIAPGDGWCFGICPPDGGWRAVDGVREVLELGDGAALAVLRGDSLEPGNR